MASWLAGWVGLILGFSGLIFVHEFGHFILAKWNGVRVYVFSLGMGPYLVSFTWRGTIYVLSLVPIGGYVKMMGQDDLNPNAPPSRDQHDYRNKRPGQKAAILAAGAIFNLLFAFLAFALCFWRGVYFDPPRLGNIAPDVPLASALLHPKSAGQPARLQKGDRILEVNGVPVKTYIETVLQVSSSPRDQDLYLKVDRQADGRADLVVVTARHDKAFGASSVGLSKYVERRPVSLGFKTEDRVAIVAEPTLDKKTRTMPAAKAGLRLGDVVLKVADPGGSGGPVARELKEPDDLINAIRGSAGRTLTLLVIRAGQEMALDVTPKKPEQSDAYQIGAAVGTQRRVTQIDEQSEAYAAGLRAGHYVLGFMPADPNAEEWKSGKLLWLETWDLQRAEEETKRAPLTVLEAGGLVFLQPHDGAELVQAESLNAAVAMAWDDTVRFSGVVFMILRGLVTGDVNTKTLSGPAGIGAGIFHVARSQTFLTFLWWLGFISLNFGVFQFLPIPLLDGWHLVMVLVERLKGSPVPLRVQEAFQYVGLFLVGALLILATYNDIVRLFLS